MQTRYALNPDKLYILYDAQCPLCSMEMSRLEELDTNKSIELVDIHHYSFPQQFPDVDKSNAMQILHGYYKGKQLLALDVTYQAWSLVGKGFWFKPLRLPVVKQVAHGVYLLFAKYRYSISSFCSRFLGVGQKQGLEQNKNQNSCQSGACYVNSDKDNRRSK